MTTEQLEVERKYDVDAATALPDLTGVLPGSTTRAREPVQLVATYLDTADLRLRAARTTLRHRTGGSDAGWHLKLPAGKDRLEVRSTAAGPPAAVPEELRVLVRAATRSGELLPVAELRTTRTVHPVSDGRGRILVEVVDDLVEATRAGSAEVLTWREWEAELVAGDRAALDAVEQRLLAAGAVVSTSASKVGRVLGPVAREQVDDATAGAVVLRHLAEQVAELTARDPQVRRDEPDAVHKMRVATRRLRSALHTFRPLLDRAATDPVRDELRWLAGSLGAARDAEVMHERLRALLADEPAELVLGPVAAKVDDVYRARYRTAHAAAVADLDGTRYLALLQALDAVLAAPAWLPDADRKARKVLPASVARVARRIDKALRAADEADGAHQDELLHEARKLAKQLRYACEAVAPVVGKDAERTAKAATALQELLGEHQDSVVLREELRALGATGSRAGQNGFTFGRLHALEQARAEARGDEWRAAWADLRTTCGRWLG